MACLSSGNFVVLVNGTPSKFFKASRGIRQGCSLSPLLFILVIEGLGLLIADARDHGLIRGINISPLLALTHLLFVDDVILLGSGALSEWMAFDVILSTFCKASGMYISLEKSCFLYNNLDVDVGTDIAQLLPYKMDPITSGFKYLGYQLKPLGYKSNDWLWLIQKFECRILHWSHKLLSLGGRLILVQAVLTSVPVYWLRLAPIPVSVINKLRSILFAFLWGSFGNKHRYHLYNWQQLSWPKKYGGWGIKNLHWFNLALRLKIFWVALQHDGLWHQVLIHKYLKHVSVVDWLRGKNFSPRGGSVIWRGFLQTLPCLGRGLAWKVGNGYSISLGIDPIVGVAKSLSLPMGLLDCLADLDIKTLASARNILPGPHCYWYSAEGSMYWW